ILSSASHPSLHSFPTRRSFDLIYTLSLHDALPISVARPSGHYSPVSPATNSPFSVRTSGRLPMSRGSRAASSLQLQNRLSSARRSEEHTSELQSRSDLVCRLLLEKKKKINLRCALG